MKHAKKLIITLSLVLLTLLTIASSILCYLFMPLAFEDPRDDAITDDIAKNRMSRWEFYKKLNESDQSEFRASIRIAVPSEAFEKFNGESYNNDIHNATLFFESYAQDFLEEHQLANYATKSWSENWMGTRYGSSGKYDLNAEFDIRIHADRVTPRTYLQEKEKILALIEDGIILSASFNVGHPQLISCAADLNEDSIHIS